MRVLKLTALTAAVAVMTACSSSGGGSSAPAPQPVVTAPTATSSNTTPATTNNGSIQGNTIKISRDQVVVSDITKTAATTQVNKVVVNGQTLDFIPTGINAGRINSQNTNLNGVNMDRVGGGSHLSYTRYGYIREGDATPALFAQGQVTPADAIPKTGTATYTGYAAHAVPGEVSLVGSKFNVDFGKSQLTGTISAPAGDVHLAATIQGNAFSGTHQGVQTQGIFYGPQAQELGGVYANANGIVSGAYGAKR